MHRSTARNDDFGSLTVIGSPGDEIAVRQSEINRMQSITMPCSLILGRLLSASLGWGECRREVGRKRGRPVVVCEQAEMHNIAFERRCLRKERNLAHFS